MVQWTADFVIGTGVEDVDVAKMVGASKWHSPYTPSAALEEVALKAPYMGDLDKSA